MPYAYQCTDCDYSQPMPFFPSQRCYLTAEGIVLPLNWQYDWCQDCDRVAAMEAFDIAELNDEAEDTARFLAKLGAQPRRRWWQRETTARRRFIEWRRQDIVLRNRLADIRVLLDAIRNRTVGPRCLDCGWTSTHSAVSIGARCEPVHAGCGGRLHRKDLGRVSGRTNERRLYKLNGELIRVVEADYSRDFDHEHFDNARLRGEHILDVELPEASPR
ncbi:hypothetical protein [Chitinimonas naiadis]